MVQSLVARRSADSPCFFKYCTDSKRESAQQLICRHAHSHIRADHFSRYYNKTLFKFSNSEHLSLFRQGCFSDLFGDRASEELRAEFGVEAGGHEAGRDRAQCRRTRAAAHSGEHGSRRGWLMRSCEQDFAYLYSPALLVTAVRLFLVLRQNMFLDSYKIY